MAIGEAESKALEAQGIIFCKVGSDRFKQTGIMQQVAGNELGHRKWAAFAPAAMSGEDDLKRAVHEALKRVMTNDYETP